LYVVLGVFGDDVRGQEEKWTPTTKSEGVTVYQAGRKAETQVDDPQPLQGVEAPETKGNARGVRYTLLNPPQQTQYRYEGNVAIQM